MIIHECLDENVLAKILDYAKLKYRRNKAFSKTVKSRPDFLIEEYKTIIEWDGPLHYTSTKRIIADDALHEIASLASEKGLGARGLRSVLDEKLLPLLFDKSLSASKGKISISVRDITTH